MRHACNVPCCGCAHPQPRTVAGIALASHAWLHALHPRPRCCSQVADAAASASLGPDALPLVAALGGIGAAGFFGISSSKMVGARPLDPCPAS
jgi:hypothetical protein